MNSSYIRLPSVLLLSIGIMLSCNVFAKKSGPIPSPIYVIGGTGPGGGIIFHVSADGIHGLEAAREDQGERIKWFNGTDIVTMAVKSGLGDGSFNTDRIITAQGNGNYAALLCANYNGGGYGDWYLPSKDELNLMYKNLHLKGLGSFFGDNYWSSTEIDNINAWNEYFGDGIDDESSGKMESFSVRAVRAF